MRLKNPDREPIGGWKYKYQDEYRNWYLVRADSRKELFRSVKEDMRANGIVVPDNIQSLIEDQICMVQPDSDCVYDGGLGDGIAKVIHTFAGAADKTLSKIGVKSNFKKQARTCATCSKRRVNANTRKNAS